MALALSSEHGLWHVFPPEQNFSGRKILGSDAVEGLRAAFRQQGWEVHVPAILNDTVATLVALRYSEPDTQLGVILGTGTNCAYMEKIDRCGGGAGCPGVRHFHSERAGWGVRRGILTGLRCQKRGPAGAARCSH